MSNTPNNPMHTQQFLTRLGSQDGVAAFRGLHASLKETAAAVPSDSKERESVRQHAELTLLLVERQFPELAERQSEEPADAQR